MPPFNAPLGKDNLENIMGKEENANYQHSLPPPLPPMFSTLSRTQIIILATSTFICRLQRPVLRAGLKSYSLVELKLFSVTSRRRVL